MSIKESDQVNNLKKQIRQLKRKNKELEEEVILNAIAADLCDRVEEALKGYSQIGESLDEAVIRLLHRVGKNGRKI